MSESDSDDAPPVKKSKTLPECPYGEKCYRKNPKHFKEFFHPKLGTSKTSNTTAVKSSGTIDTTSLPPCKYGAACYRKNLLHFAEFSHPTSSASTSAKPDSSGDDTDVMESEDEKEDKNHSKVKGDTSINRGASLVKKYSQMSEEERKELIKKAFEMKEELEKELKETKKEMERKEKELNKLQEQMNTGMLLVDGEKEALEGDKIKFFPIIPERQYKEGSAAQVHFRLAESQFYRLLSGSSTNQYRVTKVEYVVNPELVKKFNKSRDEMKKKRGEEFSHPILAFHGTEEKNIVPICKTGFRVPVCEEDHLNDEGYYGKGVYFSEYPDYSMDYIIDADALLLSKVLLGKVYHCKGMITGKPLSDGFDSHMSPCKKELVIFHSQRILPCYIVHYKHTAKEFKYVKPPEERRKITKQDELMKLYWKAKKCKKSTSLAGFQIAFHGKLCDSHDELSKLIQKHGATFVSTASPKKKKGKGGWFGGPLFGGGAMGASAYFTLLVTTDKDFKQKTNLTLFNQAVINRADVVRQEFIYDCIVKNDKLEPGDYELEEDDD